MVSSGAEQDHHGCLAFNQIAQAVKLGIGYAKGDSDIKM